MSDIVHGEMIPLIGGEAIAAENIFGTPPSFILSEEVFKDNDSHLLHWYKSRGLDIPYYFVDKVTPELPKKIDAVFKKERNRDY